MATIEVNDDEARMIHCALSTCADLFMMGHNSIAKNSPAFALVKPADMRKLAYRLIGETALKKQEPQEVAKRRDAVRLVFESAPGPTGAVFVDAEDSDGYPINCGNWSIRPDGYAELTIYLDGKDITYGSKSKRTRTKPVARDASQYRTEVFEAVSTLVDSYVRKGDGSIAMIAADGGAHSGVRDAWRKVADWIKDSSRSAMAGDMSAINALIDKTMPKHVHNMTNLMAGELKAFEDPTKKIVAAVNEAIAVNSVSLKETARIVRKAVRKELRSHLFEVHGTDNSEMVDISLESVGFVKLDKASTDEFNGSNGDPSVVVTFPTMHNGAGGASTTRFTGVLENEKSGERWLVHSVIMGRTTMPYVREADVTRLPD